MLGSAGAAWLGLPGVFFVPACVCGLVGLGFYLMRLAKLAASSAAERYGTADGTASYQLNVDPAR